MRAPGQLGNDLAVIAGALGPRTCLRGYLALAWLCAGLGLAACAWRSAFALAAAAARAAAASALAAFSASWGVIQLSIGPRAARQTLPW